MNIDQISVSRQLLLEQRYSELSTIENMWRDRGYQCICGIDEVGRGSLAGPVVACCLALPPNCTVLGLDDSKRLSSVKRIQLKAEIDALKIPYGIGVVESLWIDQNDILTGTKLAMQQAFAQLALKVTPDLALVDGNQRIELPCPSDYIVAGDQKTNVIATASIVAKVYRDALMVALGEDYPEYGFAKNKGYGTNDHRKALQTCGMSPQHRRSFLTKLEVSPDSPYHIVAGKHGEDAVAAELERQGYTVIATRASFHNLGELDLVCQKNEVIYAVEVKARSSASHALGDFEQALTPAKIRRLKRSLQAFLQNRGMLDVAHHLILAKVSLDTQGRPRSVEFVPVD